MSEKPSDADPVLDHLRERRHELNREIDDRVARLNEIERLIEAISDGRSRVSKQRRQRPAGNSTVPPPTQPEAYDDRVPSDKARGILRPEADAVAEQETANG